MKRLLAEKEATFLRCRKGQDSKIVKEFNASAGQKIRLLSFGSTNLDQLRTNFRPVGADGLFDLGNDQELRIVGVSSEIISSIQIELDRSRLVPTFGDDFTLSVLIWKTKPVTRRGLGAPILNMGV